MNELERKTNRARIYRLHLNKGAVNKQWEWCIHVGLWETLGWSNDSARYHIFRWYITGKDEP